MSLGFGVPLYMLLGFQLGTDAERPSNFYYEPGLVRAREGEGWLVEWLACNLYT